MNLQQIAEVRKVLEVFEGDKGRLKYMISFQISRSISITCLEAVLDLSLGKDTFQCLILQFCKIYI